MPDLHPVLLGPASGAHDQLLESLAGHAARLLSDPLRCFELPLEHPVLFPIPGRGATRTLWETFATLGATDLSLARLLEPHLDALAILAEAEQAGLRSAALEPQRLESATWGVFAAEGPGRRLVATDESGAVRLSGAKPWCSLAGSLTRALVTAWVDEEQRGLYAVSLTDPGVVVEADVEWVARGLADVPSGPVTFTDVLADPVGPPGWYLQRPGFAWGGIGVAAIWFGGTVALARRVFDQARGRAPDQIGQAHLGAIDAAVTTARFALADAAQVVDGGAADPADAAITALRCRQVVARAAETVLQRVDHALGPAPLALEEQHAKRVADLHLYVRQEHAERDQAALGRHLLTKYAAEPPW